MLYVSIPKFKNTDQTFEIRVGHITTNSHVHIITHPVPLDSNNEIDFAAVDVLHGEAYKEGYAKINYLWPNAPPLPKIPTLTPEQLEAARKSPVIRYPHVDDPVPPEGVPVTFNLPKFRDF